MTWNKNISKERSLENFPIDSNNESDNLHNVIYEKYAKIEIILNETTKNTIFIKII